MILRRDAGRIWKSAGALTLAAASLPALLAGPPSGISPPDYAQIGKPNQEEGRLEVERFREAGPVRPYFLAFQLHQLPRRGQEQVFGGRLWGARSAAGNVLRIELNPGEPGERRFLIQNGEPSSVVLWQKGESRPVGSFEALVPGTEITAFDLQSPYLYWPDPVLVGVTRVRTRPADQFLFRPPAGFKATGEPDFEWVRAFLDTEFHAPVQIEWVGKGGRVLKTQSLVDVQKVGDQWLPKDIEVRDESTRDKTRISLTAADLNVELRGDEFSADALGTPLEPPPPAQLVPIGP